MQGPADPGTAGSGKDGSVTPPDDALLAYGVSVTTALLGVDALYRRESGDTTGLAVLNLDTDGRFAPDDFPSYEEAAGRFEVLRREAAELREADRRVYYDQLCHSTLAFIRWRTRGLAFRDQLRDFLHVPAGPASDPGILALEDAIGEALGALGYDGGLAERCEAWEARQRVPADEVEDTLDALLLEAWERSEERLLRVPAERNDRMRAAAVTGMPFNARCDYLARTVEVNIDPVLTLPGLRHLAVHEGCPGHYLQFKLRETGFLRGTSPADVLLSVVNSASSCVFEGIADAGLEMLGWGHRPDDRIQSLLNRHRAALGTAAAWRLHERGWTSREVAGWLGDRSLMGGEGWVANRIAFIAAAARAVLIWSYWWGEPSVLPVWRRVPPHARPDFLRYLHGRMHSNRTVAMFDPLSPTEEER